MAFHEPKAALKQRSDFQALWELICEQLSVKDWSLLYKNLEFSSLLLMVPVVRVPEMFPLT